MKNKTTTRKREAAPDSKPFQENGASTLSERKLRSPTPEQIRQRALEIHKARGGGSGHELDDWLQAEREFLAEQERPVNSGVDRSCTLAWPNGPAWDDFDAKQTTLNRETVPHGCVGQNQ